MFNILYVVHGHSRDYVNNVLYCLVYDMTSIHHNQPNMTSVRDNQPVINDPGLLPYQGQS
jgi:hypothetical protein